MPDNEPSFHCAMALLGFSSARPGLKTRKALTERRITTAAQNHLLTNSSIWSPDSEWIVYDTRKSLRNSTEPRSRR